MGSFGPLVDKAGEKGYIYYEAFQDFEEKTGIKAEVQYFPYLDKLEEQVLEDRKYGKVPDVLIIDQGAWVDFKNGNNMYRILNGDWFFDLKPYIDQDELYTNGNYYEKVLESGTYQNSQLLLPLSFNIKTIFTSRQTMEDTGIYLYPEMNGQELLMQMEQACVRAEKRKPVIDTLSLWSSASMMIPVFWESTGLPPVDYEAQAVTLDQDLFEDMAVFIKAYFKQDMEENWDEIVKNAAVYLNSGQWGIMDMPDWNNSLDAQRNSPAIHQKEEAKMWLENGAFYVEGNSNSTYRHGFTGQCMALDTLYDERKEKMQMIGIPMYRESDAYIAEVQMMGGVMKESESPYYAYQLLKFILDHEYTPYYSVSVSKEVTTHMLDELEKMTYKLYLSLGNTWDENIDLSKEREEYQYVLNPLKSERREQIDYMLDHVAGAVLPQCSIYMPISWHLQAYALEYETLEEAYEGACRDLEKALMFTLKEG
ncbi:MAG: hypothetical protein HFE64_06095 [Lachnospiraceae bacterium]|nr:hypothetical protein [Lachnospiraceae bacterium]